MDVKVVISGPFSQGKALFLKTLCNSKRPVLLSEGTNFTEDIEFFEDNKPDWYKKNSDIHFKVGYSQSSRIEEGVQSLLNNNASIGTFCVNPRQLKEEESIDYLNQVVKKFKKTNPNAPRIFLAVDTEEDKLVVKRLEHLESLFPFPSDKPVDKSIIEESLKVEGNQASISIDKLKKLFLDQVKLFETELKPNFLFEERKEKSLDTLISDLKESHPQLNELLKELQKIISQLSPELKQLIEESTKKFLEEFHETKMKHDQMFNSYSFHAANKEHLKNYSRPLVKFFFVLVPLTIVLGVFLTAIRFIANLGIVQSNRFLEIGVAFLKPVILSIGGGYVWNSVYDLYEEYKRRHQVLALVEDISNYKKDAPSEENQISYDERAYEGIEFFKKYLSTQKHSIFSWFDSACSTTKKSLDEKVHQAKNLADKILGRAGSDVRNAPISEEAYEGLELNEMRQGPASFNQP